MKKKLLLPHTCKMIGWVVFIPLLILSIWVLLFESSQLTEKFYDIEWANEALVIGLSVSMIMLAFSREKDEDEYTTAIRSRYLTLAFYLDAFILIVGTLMINDLDYLTFTFIQIFLVLLLFIVMFNIAMWRLRRIE